MKESVKEVEIKIPIANASRARALLKRTGFRIKKRRVFESNVLYDTAEQTLRGRREILRVRTVGRDAIVTYKGPPEAGPHKSREEVEYHAGSGELAALVFERLGFRPMFRYEKFRTEYVRGREPGEVTLDETPIGVFLELEGPPAWIDRTAIRLGFSPSDYVTASYGSLYLDYARARGVEPTHMVFTRRRRNSSGNI